jgi:hypothetical protein
LVETAKTVFAEIGPAVTLDEIARPAGGHLLRQGRPNLEP